LLDLVSITFEEYRSFALKHPNDLSWFYWSTQKDRGMIYLEVVQNSCRVGVVGVLNADDIGCEILIDNSNRRKGIGRLLISELQRKFDSPKFKVSKYNRDSLAFFRSCGLNEEEIGQFVEFYSK
jgi:GNAT superfamily N-acetyltransferase